MSKSRLAVLLTRTLGCSVRYNNIQHADYPQNVSTITLDTVGQIRKYYDYYITVEDNTNQRLTVYSS